MTARDAADRAVTLDVNILGRDYRIACKESERAELSEAVAYLDRRMREIRDQGKIAGAERIAVMAALNIAHELLRAQSRGHRGDGAAHGARAAAERKGDAPIDAASAQRRIHDMGAAIDTLLASQDKLF
ncbi:MAG TPA: cell division protein ZapA [Casimicrobiaceae bacterium]|jgi:cell division protein ZapA